jgi:hypothetical protein
MEGREGFRNVNRQLSGPGVKRIVWTEPAKADVRILDKPTAMRIFSALRRFAESGAGDVKALQGEREELRLRIGVATTLPSRWSALSQAG